MLHVKMLKYFFLGVILALGSSAPGMAISWSMNCTVNKTEVSFSEAKKTGKINSQLKDCIADQKKAEGNPNSTNAFLKKCQQNGGKLPTSLQNLCNRVGHYHVKGNILSSITKTASKAVPKKWDMSCNMQAITSAYKNALATNAIPQKIAYCIGNKKMAEANTNSTNTFLKLCNENAPAEGSKLEALCHKASEYNVKDSLASLATRQAAKQASNIKQKILASQGESDVHEDEDIDTAEDNQGNPEGNMEDNFEETPIEDNFEEAPIEDDGNFEENFGN